uniref:Uncharacterized protein n=1 Tax=Gasterosteus aculeatus TaxID=69293 RepID=G3PTG9_GASAC
MQHFAVPTEVRPDEHAVIRSGRPESAGLFSGAGLGPGTRRAFISMHLTK